MTNQTHQLQKEIKGWLLFFMISIIGTGITAFSIQWQIESALEIRKVFPQELINWLNRVNAGVKEISTNQPYMLYGTDWMAFAHIVIGIAFIGPYRNPVKNKWIVEWGIITCALIIPTALIAGPIRGIPFFHQLIDCMFGILGVIPLWIVRNKIIKLESVS